ncbi:Ketoreductase CTB6 [Paramyrothecium foliicola]|nr:Ketoreductase CTB6 [Paramyrothecium foliicola]
MILLTGATGFLGYRILLDALETGYKVRVAVRSESKAHHLIRSAPVQKALSIRKSDVPDQLSWVAIPDMTLSAASGVWNAALKDITHIIHVASPIPSLGKTNAPDPAQFERFFVHSTVAATLSLLESAARAGCKGRFIMTSSESAIVPYHYLAGASEIGVDGSNVQFNANSRNIAPPKGPYGSEFEAYCASKAAALNAAENFMLTWQDEGYNQPGFDLVHILPSYILGHDERAVVAADLCAGSTNALLMGLLLGHRAEYPLDGNVVSLGDCAKLHLLALEGNLQEDATGAEAMGNTIGGKSYVFIASSPAEWESAHGVLRDTYPQAVSDGNVSLNGKQPSTRLRLDVGRTEQIFGIKFKPFHNIVREVVDQYLGLLARDGTKED